MNWIIQTFKLGLVADREVLAAEEVAAAADEVADAEAEEDMMMEDRES